MEKDTDAAQGKVDERLQADIEKQAKEMITQAEAQGAQEKAAGPAGAQRQAVNIDEAGVPLEYSNFCYTAGTREGVLFGFGFHDWQPGNAIKVTTKVEMSYFNAKKLLATLNQVVKRHEDLFGAIETDIRKRQKK